MWWKCEGVVVWRAVKVRALEAVLAGDKSDEFLSPRSLDTIQRYALILARIFGWLFSCPSFLVADALPVARLCLPTQIHTLSLSSLLAGSDSYSYTP